ncbi:hypothetical protein [Rasiella sp. SM2506]|uniref:hypothetical protein n=1 Tax=Rasiella sp. SM2506 TaxID=3423914 RepID=UPI003D7979CF
MDITLIDTTFQFQTSKVAIDSAAYLPHGFRIYEPVSHTSYGYILPDNFYRFSMEDSTGNITSYKTLEIGSVVDLPKLKFVKILAEVNPEDLENGKVNLFVHYYYQEKPNWLNFSIPPKKKYHEYISKSFYVQDHEKLFLIYDDFTNSVPLFGRNRLKQYISKEQFKKIRNATETEIYILNLILKHNNSVTEY